MPQLEYVRSQIKREIKFFRQKRNYNRAMSLLFVCAAAVLAALATVSLGASKMLNKAWLEVVALVSSGLATWGYCRSDFASQTMAHKQCRTGSA